MFFLGPIISSSEIKVLIDITSSTRNVIDNLIDYKIKTAYASVVMPRGRFLRHFTLVGARA